MDSQRQQAAERIKQATNILVTVSNNPSVDQLAACIGVTLALNKMGKHATAVFSGQVPSTLEFLQPEKTIEKNTDSLRDFIIALDKSKADKLRYKVEDRVVKIFITPYRTSISDKDLEFSQGDFNVDVVLALGVHSQAELDQAITSHGRILHDATIMTINTRPGGELGSINWLDPAASSLSELATELVASLDRNMIDGQIATAFLTGIVSETDRFSNAKTSPQTMSVSAELMGAGANQQLVASKLEEPAELPPRPIAQVPGGAPTPVLPAPKKANDGTLEIAHEESRAPLPSASESREQNTPEKTQRPSFASMPQGNPASPPLPPAFSPPAPELPEPQPTAELPEPPQIRVDDQGGLGTLPRPSNEDEDLSQLEGILPPAKHDKPTISRHHEPPKMVITPPPMDQGLNATNNGVSNDEEGPGLPDLPTQEPAGPLEGQAVQDQAKSQDEPSQVGGIPIISPEDQNAPGTSFLGDQPVVASEKPLLAGDESNKTLTDIERDVHSSHLSQTPVPPAFMGGTPPAPAPLMEPSPQTVTPAASQPALPPLSNEAPAPPVMSSPVSPVVQPQPTDQSIPSLPTPGAQPDIPSMVQAPNESELTAPSDTADTATNAPNASTDLDSARDAVMQALNSANTEQLDPVQSLNAQPLPAPLQSGPEAAAETGVPDPLLSPPQEPVQPWMPSPAAAPELDEVQKAFLQPSPALTGQAAPGNTTAPPPVPPPMMPPMPPAA
ncbi:MAG TPA: hypothetical protein VF733_00120 [Candidatus Saccharimonadales bacterium]